MRHIDDGFACFGYLNRRGAATAVCRPNFSPATRRNCGFGVRCQACACAVLWSGEESFSDRAGGISTACPSGVTADAHESFHSAGDRDRTIGRCII